MNLRLGLLGAAALLTGGGEVLAQQPPTPVRVDEVLVQEVQQRRRVTGEIRAARRSLVASREPGLVAEILVREGQHVAKGQVLARLDAERLQDEIRILEAQEDLARTVVKERTASAEQAQSDLKVLEGLAERDAVNPKELADARTAVVVGEARLAQAEKEILVLGVRRKLLELRVEDMEPAAPFEGFVVARHAEAGQWVEAGGAIVELLSAQELEAWLDVPQAYFASVSGSQRALWVDLDGGDRYEVSEWRVVPLVNPNGRSFPLIVTLPGTIGLAAGMSLTAEVPTGARAEHQTVPRDALLRGDTGYYVYVARSGGEGAPPVAEIVPVELLFFAEESRAAVRSPRLSKGDLVVVEGNERLYPSAVLQLKRKDGR